MFVRLLTGLSGVNGSHGFGSIIEMEDEEAGRFIAANLAEPAPASDAKDPSDQPVQPPPQEPAPNSEAKFPSDPPPTQERDSSIDDIEAHRATDDGMPEPSKASAAAETKDQTSTSSNSDPA